MTAPRVPLLGCLLAGLLTAGAAWAVEGVRLVSPRGTGYAGAPVVFHVQVSETVAPVEASVFVRRRGTGVFREVPMDAPTRTDFRAILPAEKAVPPGLEYYVVIEDAAGRVITVPAENPKTRPRLLELELDRSPPRVLEIAPGEGARIGKTTRIRVRFEDPETRVDPGSLRLRLDGTDVTALSEVSEGDVRYRPAELSHGRHTVSLDLRDVCGNRADPVTWTFTVPEAERLDRALAELRWDGEMQRRILRSNSSHASRWALQSRAGLTALLESGAFRSSLDADTWYTEEAGPSPLGDPFQLNHVLYRAAYDQHFAAVGDVTVEGSELTRRSLVRRGGRAGVRVHGVEAEAFAVRSNAITGFEHGLGWGDADQRLVGGSLERAFLEDDRLGLRLFYATGRNAHPDHYNVSTLEGGTEGDVLSLSLGSRIWGDRLGLEAELCDSRFDGDLSDDRGEVSDRAWRGRLHGEGEGYDWEAGYTYLGPRYRSITDPFGLQDRETWDLGLGWRALSSFFRASLVHHRDNVDEDPLMPVVENSTAALGYDLVRAGWPAVFLHYTLNQQETSREPEAFSPIENRTQTLGGGFSVSGERWSLSPSYSITRFDDRSAATDRDSRTQVATLSGSFLPWDRVAVHPSFSYTRFRAEPGPGSTETFQGTVGGVIALIPDRLNLNTTLSVLDNRSLEGAFHTTTFNGIGQVNWRVPNERDDGSRQTLSLRGEYGRTRDHAAGDSREDYAVFGVVSFHFPVQLF